MNGDEQDELDQDNMLLLNGKFLILPNKKRRAPFARMATIETNTSSILYSICVFIYSNVSNRH